MKCTKCEKAFSSISKLEKHIHFDHAPDYQKISYFGFIFASRQHKPYQSILGTQDLTPIGSSIANWAKLWGHVVIPVLIIEFSLHRKHQQVLRSMPLLYVLLRGTVKKKPVYLKILSK